MFDGILNSSTHWAFLLVGIIAGFVLIIYGGDYFVNSAIWMAKVTHIPEMIIGATIVSIGTTLPEVFVSFTAAAGGQAAMAVGNATGSVLCNAALILGIAMACSVSNVDRKEFLPKISILVGSIVLLFVFSLDGTVGMWECLVLLLVFALFMAMNIISATKQMKFTSIEPNQPVAEDIKDKKAWFMLLMFAVGAVGIAIGANLLISSVSGVASQLGISTQIISLTVVAFGTSLPELVTTLTSIKKKSNAISLGNIMGANILNITLITGGSGIILSATNGSGLVIPSSDTLSFMVTIACIGAVMLLIGIPTLIKKRTFKWQGITMLVIYAGYLTFLISQSLA